MLFSHKYPEHRISIGRGGTIVRFCKHGIVRFVEVIDFLGVPGKQVVSDFRHDLYGTAGGELRGAPFFVPEEHVGVQISVTIGAGREDLHLVTVPVKAPVW